MHMCWRPYHSVTRKDMGLQLRKLRISGCMGECKEDCFFDYPDDRDLRDSCKENCDHHCDCWGAERQCFYGCNVAYPEFVFYPDEGREERENCYQECREELDECIS